MKVAIVCDWLQTYGGAERVIEQIIHCFPSADLFAVVDFVPEGKREWLCDKTVQTTFIQKIPFARRVFRAYLPLMPIAIERLDVLGYDVVISCSHAVAKGVITSPDQLHICYHQARNLKYAYEDRVLYGKKGFLALVLDYLLHRVRIWDAIATKRPDYTVVNSRYVRNWYKKVHEVQSEVIYPPVDIDYFINVQRKKSKREHYIVTARLVPYKRIDLIVQAFNRLGYPLVIIGSGSEEEKLKKIAQSNVQFLGFRGRDVIREKTAAAKAFIFANSEDFGIAPIEAMACGTPVIAYRKGGALDTVIGVGSGEKPTGIFFDEQTVDSLINAVNTLEQHAFDVTAENCMQQAAKFSNESFQKKFSEYVCGKYDTFKKTNI